MGMSVLHIKSEVECKVFLFDEEKGIATPGKYLNLEVRKGEQELVFVSTSDNNLRCEKKILVEDFDSDYKLQLNSDDFVECPISSAKNGDCTDLFKLGCCYYRGKGIKQNRQLSISNWQESFAGLQDKGLKRVCAWNLGMCYQYGIGVQHDIGKAIKWFKEAFCQDDDFDNWISKLENKVIWEFVLSTPIEIDLYTGLHIERYVVNQFTNNLWGKIDGGYKKNAILPAYYLFFDTETTGLPSDEDEPASNTDNWPRLVQLAWILTDEDGECLSSKSVIIKPFYYSIPENASKIHGITTERANKEGFPHRYVLESFLEAVKKAKYLVGHNISFDQKVVGAELCRYGFDDIVSTSMDTICTMKDTINICAKKEHNDEVALPFYGGEADDENDYLSLQDLYWELFEDEFDDAHDAMADTTACMKCFFELKRRNMIYDPLILDEDD